MEKEADVVDIIKMRHKKIEDTLKRIKEILNFEPQVFENEINEFGFKGLILSLFQGLLDLSNALLISQDITPTNYKEIFMYLIQNNIIQNEYEGLLMRIIDIRNALLFGHVNINALELFSFIKENLDRIMEIYHSVFKLLGEL